MAYLIVKDKKFFKNVVLPVFMFYLLLKLGNSEGWTVASEDLFQSFDLERVFS